MKRSIIKEKKKKKSARRTPIDYDYQSINKNNYQEPIILLVWYILHFDTNKTHIILNFLKKIHSKLNKMAKNRVNHTNENKNIP